MGVYTMHAIMIAILIALIFSIPPLGLCVPVPAPSHIRHSPHTARRPLGLYGDVTVTASYIGGTRPDDFSTLQHRMFNCIRAKLCTVPGPFTTNV